MQLIDNTRLAPRDPLSNRIIADTPEICKSTSHNTRTRARATQSVILEAKKKKLPQRVLFFFFGGQASWRRPRVTRMRTRVLQAMRLTGKVSPA